MRAACIPVRHAAAREVACILQTQAFASSSLLLINRDCHLQGTYEVLVRQGLNSNGDCPSGINAVALSVIPSFLSLYRPPKTPAAKYLTASQIDTTVKAAESATNTLTNPRFGLLQQEPKCLFPNSPPPDRADISLNAWGLWLVNQLTPVAAAAGHSAAQDDIKLASAWGTLAGAAKTWQKALETQLVADAVAARAAQPSRVYDDYTTLSWARLVLGAAWQPKGVSADAQKDLGMQRLLAAVNNASLGLSVGTQARAGLALLGQNKTSSPEATKIADRLLSNVRAGGRTAYVATGDGDRAAASEFCFPSIHASRCCFTTCCMYLFLQSPFGTNTSRCSGCALLVPYVHGLVHS